jgi:hypothetical protein
MRDMVGNTLLHLCVIHHLQSMYSHINQMAKNTLRQELRLQLTKYRLDWNCGGKQARFDLENRGITICPMAYDVDANFPKPRRLAVDDYSYLIDSVKRSTESDAGLLVPNYESDGIQSETK